MNDDTKPSLLQLPDNIIEAIANHLSAEDNNQLMTVNKHINKTLNESLLISKKFKLRVHPNVFWPPGKNPREIRWNSDRYENNERYISTTFEWDSGDNINETNNMTGKIQMLVDNPRRFGEIKLNAYEPMEAYSEIVPYWKLLEKNRLTLSKLEVFSTSLIPHLEFWNGIEDCPELRHLSLAINSKPSQWGAITALLELIFTYKQITKYSFQTRMFEHIFEPRYATISIVDHITELTINDDSRGYTQWWHLLSRLPNLNALHIKNVFTLWPRTLNSIFDAINRHNPRLTILTLDEIQGLYIIPLAQIKEITVRIHRSGNSLLQFLRVNPTLRSVRILCPYWNVTDIDEYLPEIILLPHIEYLTFEGSPQNCRRVFNIIKTCPARIHNYILVSECDIAEFNKGEIDNLKYPHTMEHIPEPDQVSDDEPDWIDEAAMDGVVAQAEPFPGEWEGVFEAPQQMMDDE
jgi:hypothetical protein